MGDYTDMVIDRGSVMIYEARHPELDSRVLQVSGRHFHPTQNRFGWLIRNSCGGRLMPSGCYVPWDNKSIDSEMEREENNEASD